MPLAKLHDPNKGFIVNDTCIVGVEACVCKSRYENPVNQTDHMEVEVPRPSPAVQGYEKDSTKDPDAEL
ncbi:ubiquitin carboxyl-terminal hydrolase family protein, partial [Trifolium medium]|nr:ubiquitin carboxyl-terminal hydrolase family protein [Trifolium medium]